MNTDDMRSLMDLILQYKHGFCDGICAECRLGFDTCVSERYKKQVIENMQNLYSMLRWFANLEHTDEDRKTIYDAIKIVDGRMK